MLDRLLRHIRIAARSLARRPTLAAVALLTLALGIGANTAMFTVVDAILLRRLPYAAPERLAAIWPDRFVSNAELEYLQAHARAFGEVAAFSPGWGMALTGAGEPRQLAAARTSTNFFRTLGVHPALGRGFERGESAPEASNVAVISHALWTAQFGADPRVVGRTVTLDGTPTVVIGVMPARFEAFAADVDAWLPLQIDPTSPFHRGAVSVAFGRLAPGATLAGATRELAGHAAVMRRLFEYADDYARGATVVSLHEQVVGGLRRSLLVLLGAVGCIVLIAAANVGNLLHARALARRREIAVHTALGAGRGRVVGLLLGESMLLALGGGALGLALAVVAVRLLRGLLPADTPRLAGVGVDLPVLLWCAGVTVLVGLACGVLPALAAARVQPQGVLRGARGDAGGRGGAARGGLVVAEIALALMLVVGAGLMLRTLAALRGVDPGFDPRGTITFRVNPTAGPATAGQGLVRWYDDLLRRIAATPGVARVGAAHHLPLSGMSWNADLEIEGRPLPPGASAPRVVWRVVAGDYLGAMGMRVVQGRALGAADDSAATRAVVITDVTAHRFWPGESPIGRRIRAGNATRRQWATVVGVVRAVHSAGLDAEPGNELFVAMAQRPQSQLHLVVRAARDGSRAAAELMPALRAQVRAVDPTATISAVRSLDALVDASVAGRRAVMALLVAFAGLGLTLGMVGVYGVVAYATEQRTREIGIRTALGARPATVVALVLGHGARLAAAGVALGLLGALAASRALGALVYGVSTTDPLTYASLALLVVAVTLAASWVPARRAATGDPLAALRSEG